MSLIHRIARARGWALLLAIAFATSACSGGLGVAAQGNSGPSAAPAGNGDVVSYTLTTAMAGGGMIFRGVGGDIDGQENPDLKAQVGDTLQITLINGDGMVHDVSAPDFGVTSDQIGQKGGQVTLTFTVDKSGQFPYYCTIPGHRQAGMEGKLLVSGAAAAGEASPAQPAAPEAVSIVREPTDLPGPLPARAPEKVVVHLETTELTGQLADGTTFTYWTFNDRVPGPFLRVRVGDTIEVHLKNSASSSMAHSVDFHAVTGPGGGATVTQTLPGEETTFTFQALNPGLFVYHCATPSVAHHIANGMFGMILVEPEGGLPPVDHEFYVMQNEIYTAQPYGTTGQLDFSADKLAAEAPEYYVFNGAVGALTDQHPLQAKVGETVRIFFGDAGPNKVSSFHVIGEIFDRVYDQGSLTSPPLTDVQTTLVPAGGAAVVEFKLQVPGRYLLVDHALSRMDRGLMGWLEVTGADAPEIYAGTPTAGSGH